jgi:CPA1 family monovalent cation:H+ antiporter
MSPLTEEFVDKFWELIDVLLNALLFVLIGLELLVISFEFTYLVAGLAAIVFVLASRNLSLVIPVKLFSKKLEFLPHTAKIMTWGGLRGGISIALALSLPNDMNRDLFLTVTYVVVVFSIIVQGLTLSKLTTKLIGEENMLQTNEH